ncbi:MAG: DUF11 domain-containing protein, partial [Bacteroidetes bacterium]|nr:DUF11 domain-containing protein [Bacteroidota bacterium]
MKQHIIILFAAVFSLLLLMQEANAAGTPAGTVISSRSKVVYTTASGARSDTIYSNSITITIAQVAAANITPATNSSVTNSDSTYVSYALTITNSGNGNDQFALSSSSTKGWATTFYHDANGNGVLDNAEITAGAISSTASIAADASYKIIARVFVPRDASLNNKVDTTTISAVSQFNNSVSVSGVVKTTVKTAYFSNIGSGLTVSPTNPQPGDNVTYTFSIVNNGSEDATGVSFSDLFPPSLFNFVSA